MNLITRLRKILLPLALFFLSVWKVSAQGKLLEKHISIKFSQKPLKQALTEIGRKGDFYFSYNTNIIKGDSLVNLEEGDRTIKQILDKLLGNNYEFVESGRYIIILQKAASPSVKLYTISGYVLDGSTNERISNASVYESNQLVSTLTDTSGFFRLRLKDKHAHATLVVSKQLYRDTLFLAEAGYDQQFTITIGRARITELSPFVVTRHHVEKTWLGRWILSSKEIVQSMNLMGFFADKPYQFSLTPGLGTHGHMGAQVINKFSLNLIGGYTAGVNGFETAGTFNIDKNDVQYVQLAGGFNVVGGKVRGVQLAGVYNLDLDSVSGVQAGGVANRTKSSVTGVQLAGIFNRVEKEVRGLQAAGIANSTRGEMRGVQVSGFLNYAGRLKGLQIGLINFADTSDGYMIGLVNIVKKGYHTLSLATNELLPVNLVYKAGTRGLYSILQAGANPEAHKKAYTIGIGIGHEQPLSGRWSWVTECSVSYFYLGNWDEPPALYRLQSGLQIKLGKKVSLFAGPAFSVYDAGKTIPAAGYKAAMLGKSSFGWSAGINFF